MSMCTRVGSLVRTASRPLRDTDSWRSLFHWQAAPYFDSIFAVAPSMRFFASSRVRQWEMTTTYYDIRK